MLLYEHQSEDNSRFYGCHLQIPCATDAEVFCFPAEGRSTFLSVNSGHRQTVQLIIAHPEGAESMQGDWPQA